MKINSKKEKSQRRKRRTRAKTRGTSQRPRLSVFRSSKHIYAQLIDDEKGKTLISANDLELKNKNKNKINKKSKKELTRKVREAFGVGKLISEKAKKEKIKKVVFDRGPYAYHGRVRALAEGAREGGLEF